MQTIGQPRHNPLQARKLAVEISPEAFEFLQIAEVLGLHHLVEFLVVSGVIKILRQVRPWPVGPDGHHPILALLGWVALAHFLLAVDFLGIAIRFAVLHITGHFGGLRLVSALLTVFALLFLGRITVIIIAVIIAAVARVFRLSEIKFAQQIERQILKSALIIDFLHQCVHRISRIIHDPVAQHVDRGRRSLWNSLSGQFFAQQKRQSPVNRHFFLVLCPGDRVSAHPHHQRGIKVFADTGEIVRAERLVTHLFNGVITGPRNRLWRSTGGMRGFAVMFQLEGETIGKSARLCGLIGGQVAPGQRHAEILARG